MITIHKCTSDQINQAWPLVSDWLAKCIEVSPPWWKLEDLKEKCLYGDYVMWLIANDGKPCGVVLSELNQFPSCMVCNVPWIAGEGMEMWLPQIQELMERWAREAGAKYLSGSGRKGWIRISNMKEAGVILVKEL